MTPRAVGRRLWACGGDAEGSNGFRNASNLPKRAWIGAGAPAARGKDTPAARATPNLQMRCQTTPSSDPLGSKAAACGHRLWVCRLPSNRLTRPKVSEERVGRRPQEVEGRRRAIIRPCGLDAAGRGRGPRTNLGTGIERLVDTLGEDTPRRGPRHQPASRSRKQPRDDRTKPRPLSERVRVLGGPRNPPPFDWVDADIEASPAPGGHASLARFGHTHPPPSTHAGTAAVFAMASAITAAASC